MENYVDVLDVIYMCCLLRRTFCNTFKNTTNITRVNKVSKTSDRLPSLPTPFPEPTLEDQLLSRNQAMTREVRLYQAGDMQGKVGEFTGDCVT